MTLDELRAWAESRTNPLDDVGPAVRRLLDLADQFAAFGKATKPLLDWAWSHSHGHDHLDYTHGAGASCPICQMPLVVAWGWDDVFADWEAFKRGDPQ